MSDAYGVIIVSGNYIGNKTKIAEALNEYSFSASMGEFTVEQDSIFYSINAQYPTVYPVLHSYIDNDGNVVEFDEEKYENGEIVEGDEIGIPLEEIAKNVSRYIEKGSISISVISNEKLHYLTFETLTINSDGSAERQLFYKGSDGQQHDGSETYSP